MTRRYIRDMRQRLGIEPDDTSRDAYIEKLSAIERLRLLCGWHLGDPSWAHHFINWARDAGLTVEDPAIRPHEC